MEKSGQRSAAFRPNSAISGKRAGLLLPLIYFFATVQVAGCYFTLVRPYLNTVQYESGHERLPFQTRALMVPLMRWAHVWVRILRWQPWPQLLSAGSYVIPFVLLFWRTIDDAQLRAWLLGLPVWFGFMFFWGILVETRVFGELLPYLTCVAVLTAEAEIVKQVGSRRVLGISSAAESDLDRRLKAA